jgi:dihydrofolate reductase
MTRDRKEIDHMRKIVVSEFLTLDGVMQAPGQPGEDPEGGFRHGGWQRQFSFDEAQQKKIGEEIAATDAYLFGRKTYEIMAAHWPFQPDTDPFAAVLNPRPKYVVSRTLREPLSWQNSNLIGDDVVERIRELKQREGGNISVLGSGELVQTLLVNDLVDELSLMINPLVLATGKRLFREGLPPMHLELIDSISSKDGILMVSYRPKAALN